MKTPVERERLKVVCEGTATAQQHIRSALMVVAQLQEFEFLSRTAITKTMDLLWEAMEQIQEVDQIAVDSYCEAHSAHRRLLGEVEDDTVG
jgi:hypothetical protein